LERFSPDNGPRFNYSLCGIDLSFDPRQEEGVKNLPFTPTIFAVVERGK
jgi:hypothetical protein